MGASRPPHSIADTLLGGPTQSTSAPSFSQGLAGHSSTWPRPLVGAGLLERRSVPFLFWQRRVGRAHRRLARRTIHLGSPERAYQENGGGQCRAFGIDGRGHGTRNGGDGQGLRGHLPSPSDDGGEIVLPPPPPLPRSSPKARKTRKTKKDCRRRRYRSPTSSTSSSSSLVSPTPRRPAIRTPMDAIQDPSLQTHAGSLAAPRVATMPPQLKAIKLRGGKFEDSGLHTY